MKLKLPFYSFFPPNTSWGKMGHSVFSLFFWKVQNFPKFLIFYSPNSLGPDYFLNIFLMKFKVFRVNSCGLKWSVVCFLPLWPGKKYFWLILHYKVKSIYRMFWYIPENLIYNDFCLVKSFKIKKMTRFTPHYPIN